MSDIHSTYQTLDNNIHEPASTQEPANSFQDEDALNRSICKCEQFKTPNKLLLEKHKGPSINRCISNFLEQFYRLYQPTIDFDKPNNQQDNSGESTSSDNFFYVDLSPIVSFTEEDSAIGAPTYSNIGNYTKTDLSDISNSQPSMKNLHSTCFQDSL
ncbi:8342_t:CDS:2 [Racocetra persica]|uniref:8342_t:CDS:1 n=1 Tax=Racocetra persica TaxID=160502 RepID=A0ACA9KQH0_9GLOM|nr:8342_t:CDS:2 [Racocetra persica]